MDQDVASLQKIKTECYQRSLHASEYCIVSEGELLYCSCGSLGPLDQYSSRDTETG